jgi:hypothetical protein
VIIHDADAEDLLAAAQEALSERGERFEVTCSRGSVRIVPDEMTIEQALQHVDQRLYTNKRSARTRQGGEGHDVLLRVLAERSLSLATHLTNVGGSPRPSLASSASPRMRSRSRGSHPNCTTSARPRSRTPSSTSQARWIPTNGR